MELGLAVFSLGAIPYLATRLFGTLFWVGIVGLVQKHGYLRSLDLGSLEIDLLVHLPEWYLHPAVLLALFLLAWAESTSERSPLVSELLRAFDSELKAGGTFLLEQAITVSAAVSIAAEGLMHAGLGMESLWGLLAAGGVWLVAKARGAVLATLAEFDDDDDLGIRRLISWLEELWVALGVWLLVLLPILALILAGASVVALVLTQQYLKRREQSSKIPCPRCAALNLPPALSCFSCGADLPTPMRIGVLGEATSKPVSNSEAHRLRLLSRRRCSECAARLPKRTLRQACPACSTEMFPSLDGLDRYLRRIDQRLPWTMLICFLLSLVPLLGLIPGILYYRLALTSSLRAYVPLRTGCVMRWVLRVVHLVLVSLQWVPLLGAVTLPLMCWVNYKVYRKVLEDARTTAFISRAP